MFSENLKSARKAKGITQEELALHLHVVRQTISKWEKGLSVPDADLLIRLSEILDVPTSKLLGATIDFEQETLTDTIGEQLSQISEQLADRTHRKNRFVKIPLAVICSFSSYLLGAAIEINPSVNLPNFGILLALLSMGELNCIICPRKINSCISADYYCRFSIHRQTV